MQQQQTVSLLVYAWLYVLAATHCLWQQTLFAEPSSVRQTEMATIFARNEDYSRQFASVNETRRP